MVKDGAINGQHALHVMRIDARELRSSEKGALDCCTKWYVTAQFGTYRIELRDVICGGVLGNGAAEDRVN